MATQVQNRRGSTAEHSTFTGAVAELTVDTDKDVVVVHDGSTAGGHPMLKQDLSNLPAGTIDNADINASAAIAGTKISPDFGSQNVTTTGTATAASFIPTSSSVPTNGVYLPSSNNVAISTNGTGRLFVDASGNINIDSGTLYVAADTNRVGISTITPAVPLQVSGTIRSTSYGLDSGYYHFDANTGNNFCGLPSANTFAIYLGGFERARIDSSGRLGLGTSAPGQQMVVRGSQPFLEIRDSRTGNWSGGDVFSGILFGTDDTTTAVDPHAFIKAVHTRAGSGHSSADAGLTFGTSASTSTPATERMRIDDQGRVGIGVTAPSKVLTIANADPVLRFEDTGGGAVNLDANASSFVIDADPTNATGSTTIQFKTDGAERARIDSSGRLLVGTSTARSNLINGSISAQLQVEGTSYSNSSLLLTCNSSSTSADFSILSFAKSGTSSIGSNTLVGSGHYLGAIAFTGNDGTKFVPGAYIEAIVDGASGANDMPTRLVFSTNGGSPDTSPTERMRIDSTGYSTFTGVGSVVASFSNNTNTSGYNGIWAVVGSNGNNTSTYHFRGNTSGVNNWYLYGNGTTSYSSDERLKKNIETTRDGYLEDIKQLRVVKYNWKNHEDGTPKELGLIAQEVEQVFPGLVQEDLEQVSDDDLTHYKQLKGSVLPVILLKALQEANAKIETLEAKVAALESA